jgi:acylphosphatase
VTIARHLLISGRVQGVGYRAWLAGEARRLRLDGWARNRVDGRVEALIAGPAETVGAMLEACRRGPPAARVADVAVSEAAMPVMAGFHVQPTM